VRSLLEERFIFSIRRVRYVLTVFTDSDSALAMSPGRLALGELEEHLELALGQLLVRRAAFLAIELLRQQFGDRPARCSAGPARWCGSR
jgi:hypothetical protein